MSIIPSLAEIPGRIARLHERVAQATAAAGREDQSVAIELAVKYQAPERVLAALDAGATLLGHNIIQQLESGEAALERAAAPTHRTHVIGHVQTNKAGKALDWADCIETLDSIKLAERLNRLQEDRLTSGRANKPFDVMIQVNSSGAASQYGIAPEEVVEFAAGISSLAHLRLIGLMTIGAHTDNVRDIARSFEIVRNLRDQLHDNGMEDVAELSMGMTHDLDIAIAEGSTIIRVGTAVFGPRPQA
ncbi:YggS family pyridoxal phosphate-dependent enzyme [Arcanobacterium haemolyticum]|nr:YggS family pyridoxal phosphate-dependent enzyme [Arcanobacterium haemolyticum]